MADVWGGTGAVDLVIKCGTVVRPAGLSPASAVGIRNGRIVAIGDTMPGELVSARTEVIEVPEGTLLPGFQDAHVHPLLAGMRLVACDLSQLHSVDAYLEHISTYASSNPRMEWITGGGWFGDVFEGGLPHRRDLDRILPDRPVILYSHDMHGVWVNSAALELAGIDARTVDPRSGRINRDESGVPTGILVESAVQLVSRLLPSVGYTEIAHALLAAQARLHAVGVTAWQDAAVGSILGFPDPYESYVRLAEEGRLTARVRGALWWVAEDGPDQLERHLERSRRGSVGRFSATHVKVMQDGIIENRTAAMLQPYGQGDDERGTGQSGASFLDSEELNRIATLVDAGGLHMHFHAVGDRAVRECLDAIEAARTTNPPWDRRHQIAHVDLVSPDDLGRFARLGVIANIQALWARRDREIVERKLPLLGAAREPYHFPFGSLAREGARLAMGSDWPVTDPNPLWAIYTAHRRVAPTPDPHAIGSGVLTDPLEPQEAIELSEAIDAYTLGSAYANNLETVSGNIDEGKAADIVVLDRPIRPDTLQEAEVVYTLVEGEIVHG